MLGFLNIFAENCGKNIVGFAQTFFLQKYDHNIGF
jgi:hypothetical protein